MEEIYIMPDGTSVDISGYSEFEKITFLLGNPKAKKSKNTAKGASTVLKKKQAPDTDSSSEKSSSGSKKKFRLPTEEEFEQYKKTQKTKPTYGVTKKQSNVYEDYYNLKPQSTEQVSETKKTEDDYYKYISQLDKADEKKEILPAFYNKKNIDTKNLRLQTEDEFEKEQFKTQNPRYYHFNKLTKEKLELDNNLKKAISDGYVTEEDINKLGIYNEGEVPSKLYTQKEITEAEKKVNFFRSKLPYEVEASLDLDKIDKEFKYIDDYDEGDDFVSNIFNVQELANIGVNDKDFNGFLLAKGYKDDIKRFKELELDKATYGNNYDSKLAWEKRKVQYLNLYLNEQIQRDLKKQKFDFIKKKSQEEGKMFDFSLADYHGFKYKPNKNLIDRVKNYGEFLKKEAPELVTAMEEVDRKNSQNYTALVQSKGNVGAGKFTLDLLENGWNGFTRTLNSFGASLYDAIIPGDFGEGLAESMRLSQEIYDFKEGENFRYVTAKGYKTTVDGVDYIYNNSNGRIYDITNKLDVTNILTEKQKEDISNKAFKEGKRDTSFSYTGTAYQGANVIGDLVFQLALTRSFGNTLSAAGGFTEGAGILGKTKSYLKSVPIARSMSEAVIAQSTLGFTRGYEDTLKAAREAGIEDDKAKELASIASIETGVWYALTAPINPQTKATDLLFGKAKNEVLEQAINAYINTGKKGFIQTLKGFGKNFLDISGEGLAEVIQENIQQVGETYVINKDVNRVAGQEILQDSMSLQDFMDTTILSFVAGAIIPGAGVATTQVKKSTREMLGMQGVDRFNALGTLAYNRQKVSDFLSKQVIEGLYTQQQVDDLLSEIDAYSSSINRMPQDISAEAAEDILEDVVTLSKLEQQKKQTDKSFHAPIEEKIDEVRSRIERRYYDDVTSKRTSVIKKAIQSGKVGNIEYREFDSEEDIVNTLISDFNYSEEDAERMASSSAGFILTEQDLRRQLDDDKFVPGKKIIFINNSVSAELSLFSVGKHEFLHGLIYETIKGDREAQILLGRALANEILSMHQEIVDGTRKGVAAPTEFLRRFSKYVIKYSNLIQKQKFLLASGEITEAQYNINVDTFLGNQWEEVLTLYSDAIDDGSVVFDDDIFTKIGDVIRRVLQRLGIKDVKFNSGKDVYNFIKDYNRSIEKGTFGGSLSKLSTTKAKVNKEALRKQVGEKPRTKPQEQNDTTDKNKEFTTEAKFSLKGDRIDPEKFKSKINSYYNKDKWNSKNYLDSTLYEILEDYSITIKQKAKGYGYSYLPDYSEEDMVAETQIALIPVIRNFNKEFFELREEYKEKLKSRGLKPGSKEFNDELEKQDEKGYKGKKGIVKENTDLNAYINSLLKFKMMDALKTGSVTSKQYNSDIDSEFFKESSVEGFDYEESEEILDDIDSLLDEQLEFEQEQSKLAVLLKDPVFGFTDENGNPIDIEIIPFGVNYVQDIDDPAIPANKKLKKATDPEEISRLKKQLEDLKRGLELEAKEELTPEEKEELKVLKSFKSFSMSKLVMENTYEAFSTIGRPSKIISEEIATAIQKAPNIQTLEYRNFKEKVAVIATTLSRRMTFKNSSDLESFMYNNWETIYNVINNPTDPVTGESTYTAKKLPPRLKQLDAEGNFIKRKDINRAIFLQSYFRDEDVRRIIRKYSKDPEAELNELEDIELNENTGKTLSQNAHFDRRTALIEMFGDVLVLQEARRLLRDEAFLESIKDRNVNLYNDLKDDIKREAVLNNMAKGKSDIVKYSLIPTKESADFSKKFKNLLKSKEYNSFKNRIGDIYHSGSHIEQKWNKHKIKVVWFSAGGSEGVYGDGVIYKTNISDLEGAIVMPDWNRAGDEWGKRFGEKFPEVKEALLRSLYDSNDYPEFIRDENGNVLYEDNKPLIKKETFEEYKKRQLEDEEHLIPSIYWLLEPENIKYADEVILEYIKGYEEDPDEYLYYSEGYSHNEDGTLGDYTEIIVFGPMDNYKIQKQDYKGNYNDIKFSLAEKNNAKSSTYLENLNVEDQLFVARIIDNAVTKARNISKKSVTFKVPDLRGMSDKVRSFFLIDKVANGYNDFEFLNKEDSKGKLTQSVLNASDIKFTLAYSNADYNSDLEIAMNEIISENNKNIDVDKKYSPETAKNIGKNIGRYEIWMPPADDDFMGLVYRLAGGKGKLGEKQIEFFEKTLIKPYSDAMLNLMHERQQMYRDWTDLVNKKYKGITKRLRKDSGYGGYTIDQAIRVYLWNKAGYEIPGLDAKDVFSLNNIVRKDKELREFANDISYISKQPNGYIEPDHNWGFGSLISDLHGGAQKASRKKYLEHWQHNVDKIFSKDNLSKIEAVYGRQYVLALKNSLERMKSGSNRVEGGNDPFLNWLNAATGVTMFFNMRSAFLQTISMVNFINTGDNNPLKVSARMLDVNQFMKDYSTLWNSDYLKDRRSNLMSDVAEAELAQAMNDPRNKDVVDKFKAGYYFMMKQGFAPTRIADSFAIAFGGASFYRNRINTYLKQGDTQEDAEKKAMRDFYETSEASQQSADVSKISKNQASLKGRLIFAFQNTPLQYSRLITRATIDIIKGRGDFKANIAKIVYYSTLQNLLFNFMQNALFSIMFDDEDEQNAQQINGKIRAFNGTLDTILRGSGLTGAVVSTLKNVAIKWYEIHGDPKQGGEVVVEALNISPPIGIKARKLMKAYKAAEYNADEIKYKGFSLDNTYAIEATTSLASVGFNLPVDRVYQKATNIGDALMGDFETWQRIALIFGYSRWNLGKGQKGAGLEPTGNGTLKQPGLKEPELKDKELKQ